MTDNVEPPAVAETHTAVLAMLAGRVIKVKKPLNLGFLDFSTVAARRAVCAREVKLNRRLAPDVYLGTIELPDAEGGETEPAVVMRRMPAERRLATLVRAGEVEQPLRQLARLLVAFHAAAETSPQIAKAGTRERVQGNWDSVLDGIRRHGDDPTSQAFARIERLARTYLAGREPLFAERIAAGRVRDGHGDLLAEDVFCLDDGPRVLDCIEFDDALRHGDVLADVAFLAMDLERLGAPDAAASFLSWYREFAGDSWPNSLVHHYIAYRALVRCLVAHVRGEQGDQEAGARADHLLQLTLSHLEAGRVQLILVGGLPGTGKTTLAAGLAERRGLVHLRTDIVRKELLGLGAEQRADRDSVGYSAQTTARTYEEMLARARIALDRGESVVLDASWTDRRWRADAASLATATVSELVQLRCVAPTEVAAERLRRRATEGNDASEATPAVGEAMAHMADPWPEATVLETDAESSSVLRGALNALSTGR